MDKLNQLVRYTPATVVDASRKRKVSRFKPEADIKQGIDPKEKKPYIDVRFWVSGVKKKHRCQIRFYEKVNIRSTVKIDCDCQYFKYYLDYVLGKVDSSEKKRAWAKPPKETNPQGVRHLCKHLYLISGMIPSILSYLRALKKKGVTTKK